MIPSISSRKDTEELAHTGLGNSLLGKCLNKGRLVALSIDELVVQNFDVGVFGGVQDDLVRNGLSIGKSGNVLADTRKGELDGIGVGSEELCLALLAHDDEVKRLSGFVGVGTDASTETGVDTTTEALIGGANDDERLLLLDVGYGRLGGLEDLIGSLAVLAGLSHGALSAAELGRGNNLHGTGDFLDVANRLATVVDFSKRRVGGSSIGADSGGPTAAKCTRQQTQVDAIADSFPVGCDCCSRSLQANVLGCYSVWYLRANVRRPLS